MAFSLIWGSCGRKPQAAAEDRELRAIRDSIVAYNVNWAKNESRRLIAATSDSARIARMRAEEAVCYYYLGMPDSALWCARTAADYITREGETASPELRQALCNAYQTVAAVYTQYVSIPDSAIHYNKLSLECVDPQDVDKLLSAYNNLADSYKYAGRLPMAVETYRNAIFMADSLGTAQCSTYVPLYSGLAGCYTDLRNFEESKYWWDKAESIWDCMTQADRSRYFNNRGSDYYYQKDYHNALRMFERLDSFCAGNPDLAWDRKFGHVNLADVYLKMGRYADAIPLIEETTDFFTSVQMNPAVMSYLYTQQMDAYRQQGDFAQVERLIREHPIPEGVRPDQAVLRLDFLRNYYTDRGNAPEALKYSRLYQELEDSLRDERVRMKTEELRSRYERDETVLRQRVTISEKETRLMRTYALAGVAAVLVLLLVIIIALERVKRQKEMRAARDNIVKMRMENIRNRITPHFIYNALNHEILARERGCPTQMPVLVNLLRRGQMLASDFCIPLDEEIEFIRLYLDVESHACGRIDAALTVADGIDLHKVMLPSMTIQIFVENAVKHAFRLMPEGVERRLRIDVSRTDGRTKVEISNNGTVAATPQARADSTGTGMRVIFQTIQMLNDRNREKIEINVSRRAGAGGDMLYVVTLSIPDNYNFGSTPPSNDN